MRECGLDSLACNLLDLSLAGINNLKYCLHFLLRILKRKKKLLALLQTNALCRDQTHLGALSPLLAVLWVAAQFCGWSTTMLLQNQILNCLHYFLTEIQFFKCCLKKFSILVT